MKYVARLICFFSKVFRHLRMHLLKALFGKVGRGFRFDPDGLYTYRNIYVGDDVNLGVRPILMAELSEIRIGNHVMFGPEVVLIGGGHNMKGVGTYMTQMHEKTGNEDLGVTIGDDVWVGARAVLLRGVNVGRGAVVAAGAVVTKSVPPYAVVGGNPARVLGFRWDAETIFKHEELLYPVDECISLRELEKWQKEKNMLAPRRK